MAHDDVLVRQPLKTTLELGVELVELGTPLLAVRLVGVLAVGICRSEGILDVLHLLLRTPWREPAVRVGVGDLARILACPLVLGLLLAKRLRAQLEQRETLARLDGFGGVAPKTLEGVAHPVLHASTVVDEQLRVGDGAHVRGRGLPVVGLSACWHQATDLDAISANL